MIINSYIDNEKSVFMCKHFNIVNKCINFIKKILDKKFTKIILHIHPNSDKFNIDYDFLLQNDDRNMKLSDKAIKDFKSKITKNFSITRSGWKDNCFNDFSNSTYFTI